MCKAARSMLSVDRQFRRFEINSHCRIFRSTNHWTSESPVRSSEFSFCCLLLQGGKGIKGPKGLPGENGCCGSKVRPFCRAGGDLATFNTFFFFQGHKGEPGRSGFPGSRGDDGAKGKQGLTVSFTSLRGYALLSSHYCLAFHEYFGAFGKCWLRS